MRLRNPTDFWAGLLFGGFGLWAAVYAAIHYRIGSALRMGPGYFPTAIGALVALLGLALVLRALVRDGPRPERPWWRPLGFVLGAPLLFAYLLEPLGLLGATVALVGVSALASRESRWREALALGVGLAVFAAAVFVHGLGLLFPLWPRLGG